MCRAKRIVSLNKMHVCATMAFQRIGTKWEHINRRLQMLDAADQEEEANLLSEAYERLICAYQEAREINDELEEILKNALMN